MGSLPRDPKSHVGPYRLGAKLGRGGMGVVYSGYDERLDRPVALKRVRRSGDGDTRRRLRREGRALAQVNHPTVVQVYDLVEDTGDDWIVMERVHGHTLAELTGPEGLGLPFAVELARQIAEGLAAAHARGLVHRDLKAENVMVDAETARAPAAKILDFGLALHSLALHSLPEASSTAPDARLVGTVRSLSPEQILGHDLDARCDLFSLGTLLYEILTGRSPFLARSTAETLDRICATAHRPVSALRDDVPAALAALVDELLSKEPELRPPNADAVARRLERIAGDLGDLSLPAQPCAPQQHDAATLGVPLAPCPATPRPSSAVLRSLPPPELPEQPYPVLLPYTHPAPMAGRDQELEEIRMCLRSPVPILGLGAPSGAGKSSLLLGGLVPALRAEGRPVAVVRHPQEPGVAGRLLGDLLVDEDAARTPDDDWRGFVRRLGEVERLAGKASLLVLDQFENVLREEAAGTRSRLGPLLAATVRRRGGVDTPLCRWLLVYRQEFHGELLAWLDDVLCESAAANGPWSEGDALSFLPRKLSEPERFQSLTLPPFATPSSGGDALLEARRIFQAAVEKPVELRDAGGGRLYELRFVAGHAERLAHAFAEARLARPAAPLVPELQVVLAHLVERADDGRLTVPGDPKKLIDEALTQHLHHALETAFPADAAGTAPRRRTRALLALRELASEDGRRDQGLPAEALARAIGDDGEAVLEELAGPRSRLVVLRDAPAGLRYVLSHDRTAEAVVRTVEEEGGRGKLLVDAELLALRRFVTLKTALRGSPATEVVATRIPRRHVRSIAAHTEALLPDEERRAWWAACRRRRRADLVGSMVLSALAAVLLALVTWSTWSTIERRDLQRTLREQVVHGEPAQALRALFRLAGDPAAGDPATTNSELLSLLRRRRVPMDVLEQGLDGVAENDRGAVVLRAVEIALPWVDETPDDPVLVANLTWALDYGPGRDPGQAARAAVLRDRVLAPLRALRSPPEIRDDDPDWVLVPTPGPESSSAFLIQRHEVTRAEARRLFPSDRRFAAEGGLPAVVTWYQAYTYAAWLGGRLPTDWEWTYAARAGCPHLYCTRDGLQATVNDVAWTVRNSRDLRAGSVAPSPVMRLEPNPWGLYDVLGNLWEWTAAWYAAGEDGPRSDALAADPWGPTSGSRRVIRGGGFGSNAHTAHVAFRHRLPPDSDLEIQGFRAVLPERRNHPPVPRPARRGVGSAAPTSEASTGEASKGKTTRRP